MNKKILIGLIFLLIFSILSYIVSIIVMKKITDDRKNPWIVEGVRPANKPLFISQNKDRIEILMIFYEYSGKSTK